MKKLVKIFATLLLAALIAGIEVFDAATGFVPDLTILYLIPLVVAAIYLGRSYALFLSLVAESADFAANIQLGVPLGLPLLIGGLFRFLVFLGVVLTINRLTVELRKVHELESRRSADLQIAREIHESVTRPLPAKAKNISPAGRRTFARELGGDYYHLTTVGERLFFCIGDISGKSISAALFTALLHQTIIDALQKHDSLFEIVRSVNERVYQAVTENMFVTLFLALIDENSMSYVNAGHETPLVFKNATGEIEALTTKATLPLGINQQFQARPAKRLFRPGDILLAFTDGVTDSPAFRDHGMAKLREILRENPAAGPEDIVEIVHDLALPKTAAYPGDDITVVCLKRTPGGY